MNPAPPNKCRDVPTSTSLPKFFSHPQYVYLSTPSKPHQSLRDDRLELNQAGISQVEKQWLVPKTTAINLTTKLEPAHWHTINLYMGSFNKA